MPCNAGEVVTLIWLRLLTFRVNRNAKIRPIHLFFSDKFMPKEMLSFGFRHDLIAPDFDTTEKRQMWCGGELEEIGFHSRIFSVYFASA